MFFYNSFSDNLRKLRARHDLSPTIFANILGLKNKVSISNMETGSTMPQYNTLVEISDFFGVSLDWLTGRTNEQYTLPTIERIEDYLLNIANHVNLRDTPDLIYFYYVAHLVLDFKNYHLFRNGFTLEERADVIYALNFWRYASHRLHVEGYDSQRINIHCALEEIDGLPDEDPPNALISKIAGILKKNFPSYQEQIQILSDSCSSKRAGTIFATECNYCIAILSQAYDKLKILPYIQSSKAPEKT
ncbi:helix-turn-helix domain-containing protein [uncultured Anaerovibrio sp.]|uniref:helix-turn-helix domain-containing protein n=1 Tax=uncultured Anaerovibrio sp. TaxID=361586 RepID=UPI002615A242|nr:helix-turn-helix transcriptional regulator [uncultured Anaerovibrio sp.]